MAAGSLAVGVGAWARPTLLLALKTIIFADASECVRVVLLPSSRVSQI